MGNLYLHSLLILNLLLWFWTIRGRFFCVRWVFSSLLLSKQAELSQAQCLVADLPPLMEDQITWRKTARKSPPVLKSITASLGLSNCRKKKTIDFFLLLFLGFWTAGAPAAKGTEWECQADNEGSSGSREGASHFPRAGRDAHGRNAKCKNSQRISSTAVRPSAVSPLQKPKQP